MEKPSSESDSVCFVVEFFGVYFVKAIKLLLLQYIGMKRGNAVNADAVMNINMSHMDALVLVYDKKRLVVVLSSYLVVQHFYYRHKLRHYLLKIADGPFFQSLRQNSMVGIGTGLAYRLNGIVHVQSPLRKQPYQFRYHHCGVSVVYLYHCVIRQIVKPAALGGAFVKQHLRSRRHHKVLLVYSQHTSRVVAVIGIKEQRQVFVKALLVEIDAVGYNGFVRSVDVEKVELIGGAVVSRNADIVHSCGNGAFFEPYRICFVRLNQPTVVGKPSVGLSGLSVVFEHLSEQSEMIFQTNAVAVKSESRY